MSAGEVLVGVLALTGSVLVLLAAVGVLRFPDLYSRMHAATKASTLGIGLVCLAGAISIDGGTAKILLAAAATFVTAPSAAHFIGRAAAHAEGVDVELADGRDLRSVLEQDDDGTPT
jgi:multicomponent Na+:H+ antiporter subunit G